MGRSKDLTDFAKGQIVMARRLGQSITETARLVGCSRSAVVSTYRQWTEEGRITSRRQGVGRPRLIDAQGQQRLSLLARRTSRGSTVAQITESFNGGGGGRSVSQHTVHRTLLRMERLEDALMAGMLARVEEAAVEEATREGAGPGGRGASPGGTADEEDYMELYSEGGAAELPEVKNSPLNQTTALKTPPHDL